MIGADMTIDGAKEIMRRLNSMPQKVARKAVSSALRPEGKRIAKIAESKIPIDEGNLKWAGLRVLARRSRNTVGVRVVTPTRKALGIAADDKGYYPAHLELGHGNVAPRPFLRGTVAEQRETSQRNIEAALWSIIRIESNKG